MDKSKDFGLAMTLVQNGEVALACAMSKPARGAVAPVSCSKSTMPPGAKPAKA
jgi:hypothetical protein